MSKPAILLLEDGTRYTGYSFGSDQEVTAEIVFNTSMSGYQEILTDPSYTGQMITMTCPHIGNVGVNSEDAESSRPWASGFIVKEANATYSNFRGQQTLDAYLKQHGIPGIEGLDTRALVKHIRDAGAMRAIISSSDFDIASLTKKIKASPQMEGQDLVKVVSTAKPYPWTQSSFDNCALVTSYIYPPAERRRVIVMDFGVKQNILRRLYDEGCDLEVVPATTTAEAILAKNPDGIFLSNGPGDPAAVTYAIETVKKLIASGKPIFGICLGHQIISLAIGCRTFKLKFGHRGGNQPVKNLSTGAVEITSQNHGFAVDNSGFPAEIAEVSHINLNDQTVEGLRLKNRSVFSVQYHPEASPGPHDADYLFKQFMDDMQRVAVAA